MHRGLLPDAQSALDWQHSSLATRITNCFLINKTPFSSSKKSFVLLGKIALLNHVDKLFCHQTSHLPKYVSVLCGELQVYVDMKIND